MSPQVMSPQVMSACSIFPRNFSSISQPHGCSQGYARIGLN
jgi:hypothetical protein